MESQGATRSQGRARDEIGQAMEEPRKSQEQQGAARESHGGAREEPGTSQKAGEEAARSQEVS